jgi:hypothetical protein
MSVCDDLRRQSASLSQQVVIYSRLEQQALNHSDYASASNYARTLQDLSSELAGLHQEMMARGCLQAPRPPLPPPIKILIVMDGSGSFVRGPNTDFSLSEVIRTLESQPQPGFQVTKAHRTADFNGGSVDYSMFKFTEVNLRTFDEIWLFGVDGPSPGSHRGTHPLAISDTERRLIAEFMEGGGGVFATGDHEDLGAYLSGQVLRVRSMRKWFVQPDVPPGWPEAPTGFEMLGVGLPPRLDTLQPDAEGNFWFDNQSDTKPQTLRLTLAASGQAHPIMVGHRGQITQFPDHMHEGEVITPWDPNLPFRADSVSFTEYPDIGNGQALPAIIARGRVIGGHTTLMEPGETTLGGSNDTTMTVDTIFGVVGAYDGHYVDRGRVVVDSTWHHWFDVNLIGDPRGIGAKQLGFTADAMGEQVLGEIQEYYVNVALWLARGSTRWDWLAGAMWELLRLQPFDEMPIERSTSAHALLAVGSMARTVLARRLPGSQIDDAFYVWARSSPWGAALPPHPWNPLASAGKGKPHVEVVPPQRITEAALGGALVSLATTFPGPKRASDPPLSEVRAAIEKGVPRGLVALGQQLRERARSIGGLGEALATCAGEASHAKHRE